MIDRQLKTIETDWDHVCDLARLSEVDRHRLRRGAFLNPEATEGYS